MFQNVIFDWSGVVNDNFFAFYKTVMEIFKTHGVPTMSWQELKDNWKTPYMEFYNQYIPDLTYEDQSIEYKKWIKKFDENILVEGIDQTIKKFFEQKINLFVVSNDFPESLLNQVKIYGLNGVFKEIICKSYDKSIDADILIKKYNLNRDRTIFIGDTSQEINAGKKVGIKTGAVTWGIFSEKKLEPLTPNFIFHDIIELEKAILS